MLCLVLPCKFVTETILEGFFWLGQRLFSFFFLVRAEYIYEVSVSYNVLILESIFNNRNIALYAILHTISAYVLSEIVIGAIETDFVLKKLPNKFL